MIEEWSRYPGPGVVFWAGPHGQQPVPQVAPRSWETEASAVRDLVALGWDAHGLVTYCLCRTCWEAEALAGTTVCRRCNAAAFDEVQA